MTNLDWFAQTPYRVRLAWGRRGAREAAAKGDVLVIVDALCFSTDVALVVAQGGVVYPCKKEEDTPEHAQALDAERTVHRDDVPGKGRFSLSPATLRAVMPGMRLLMGSTNGATCVRHGVDVPALFAGAFVNAEAVAEAVARYLAEHPGLAVTVVACGERWDEPDPDDGDLRFALEDYLGAGAILSHLPENLLRSPEAMAAAVTFRAVHTDLPTVLRTTGSGVELIERGYPGDVEEAARYNTLSVAPRLRDGAFVAG